jgi:biotin--protein ligase
MGAVAGIQVPVGSGHAAFWGISPYLDGIKDTASVLALFRYALTSLGLSVPPERTLDGPLGPLQPIIPRHPLPQFLLHPRGKRHVADTVLRGLGLSVATADSESSSDSEVGVIKDDADTFHVHRAATLGHAARLVAEAKRTSTDTSSHAAMAMDAPRVVLVLPPDVLPIEELTPRFDVGKYFNVLADVRRDQTSDTDNWGMGEALFYGEAVTSTQTMLDRYAHAHTSLSSFKQTVPNCRNPRFQAALPTPIVSLATFQLAGRGRGSNAWLSPPGCLQFSILVRAPLRASASASALPAPRLVFVQYLVGLAVVHACRDERALGAERGARVRLKWPNDVYVDLPAEAGGEKKKVGGILVNASFSDGNVNVVVGALHSPCFRAYVSAHCPRVGTSFEF